MKMKKNQILALSLALLITLSMVATSISIANAEEAANDVQSWPVEPKREGVWYKFETPLVTLLFPAGGKKPMFIWWYTNDTSEIYVVKFKGVIEYLTFDAPYYIRRYPADGLTIQERLREMYIYPKTSQLQAQLREQVRNRIMENIISWIIGLHPPYLPFSGCTWELEGPELVTKENTSYWAFNFTLKSVPMYLFSFAVNNIQIKCRFYNTTTTEIIDESHNYTVAAGQLKFDFVVSNWEWNLKKLEAFVDWLKIRYPEYNIDIPINRTGLALWMNMASIKIEDLNYAENEVQNQTEGIIETESRMQAAMINDQYYPVNENKTALGEYERPIQLTERFRERVRIHFTRKETTMAGFLEFVPWARLLNETGDTVDYVNVTASYIAAGAHLRLFICYPYFGNYTLEHDPTIGLALAPPIPTLITPELLIVLIGATVIIAIAAAVIKIRKKPVNILTAQ
ncbi:MAG: hypothetical protein OEY95_07040 [Candidatus Bathyarchaeota archaeon]|nr:hypothetical protein [Candidatus Bathyarchaeota archaeon]